MKSLNKDFLRCLSLANLWFFPSWYNLLETPFQIKYYQQNVFTSINPFLAIVLNVLLLALIFWGSIKLIRRLNNEVIFKVSKLIFIGFFTILIILFIRTIPGFEKILVELFHTIKNKLGGYIFYGLVIFFMVLLITCFKKRIVFIINNFLMIMLPFVLITFFQAGINGVEYSSEKLILNNTPTAPKLLSKQSSPRVLWIIFDEMDWKVAFGERLPILQLPEFDRFKKEAIYANNAYPPAGQTNISMPAYITGKLISNVTSINGDLMLKFGKSEAAVKWSEQPSVFSKAQELGFNTAMVGFYHPYGRILKNNLIMYYGTLFNTIGILETMYEQYMRSISKITPINRFALRQDHIAVYNNLLENTKKIAINSELDFILIHFPIPHYPQIYNRLDDQFTTIYNVSYLDNLALADKTLGEIRKDMESVGVWDNTTIIITSDHYWRVIGWLKNLSSTNEDLRAFNGKADGRIPFLIKLAGQKNHVIYEKEFNTVVTHDLILAILRQEVATTDDVINWLDQHNEFGESPYIPKEYKKNKNGE